MLAEETVPYFGPGRAASTNMLDKKIIFNYGSDDSLLSKTKLIKKKNNFAKRQY